MMSTDDLQSEGEQNGEVHDIRLRCNAAHKDDSIAVKIVVGFAFIFLPGVACVGVWAACLMFSPDMWYEITLTSPLKLPFYVFGGVWCGVSVVTGFSLFLVWYVKGCRRFLPFLLLGITILLLAFAYPALLIVGHFIIYSFVAITLLWLILIVSLVFFSNVSVLAGLCSLPILIWTTYTAFFNFYPFYNELFGDQQER